MSSGVVDTLGLCAGVDDAFMAQGKCQGHRFPDLWTSTKADEAQYAKAICQTCPVRGTCLMWALNTNQVGTYGATTTSERRGL